MKFKKKISVLLLMATFISCDQLDELTEFDVTDSFTTTISVSISDSATEAQNFSESATLDISSNQDIQDNLDLIQNIGINSMTYEITNYIGDTSITITNASLNVAGINISVDDLNLQQADDNNSVYAIENSQQLNSIANILENSPSITATLIGTISGSPVNFDIIINVDLTATIDII